MLSSPPLRDQITPGWLLSPAWTRWIAELHRVITRGPDRIAGLPEFADNAAALAGGLQPDALYRTATGVVMVVF